jgi:hypothetical protein
MNATTIEEMKLESARLKDLARNLDAIIAAYSTQPSTQPPHTNGIPVRKTTPPVVGIERMTVTTVPVVNEPNYSEMTQADACFDILSRAGAPMSREAIFEKAKEGGSQIQSVDHLSPVLSRDKRLQHIGRGMWAIRTEPQPASAE